MQTVGDEKEAFHYANVFQRVFAFLIDYILINLVIDAEGHAFVLILHAFNINTAKDLVTLIWINFVLSTAIMFAYFWLSEGYLMAATIGKKIVKITVTTTSGAKLPLATSFLRTLYKLLPILFFTFFGVYSVGAKISDISYLTPGTPLNDSSISKLPLQVTMLLILLFALISYGMAFFNSQKQALHDKMAKTLVIDTDAGPLSIPYKDFAKFIKSLRRD